MRHLTTAEGVCLLPGTCLAAIGTFDGVHAGHQTILREMVLSARSSRLSTVVLTFEPHPQEVLSPDGGPPRLSSRTARADLIAAVGVETLVTLPFDLELAALDPESFVRRYLGGDFRPASLYVGYNFTFGQRGRGNAELLRQLGRQLGFAVRVFLPLTVDGGQALSSTAVREALAAGQVESAARLLGRPYRLAGTVVRGDQRGRTIGFPTANVQPCGRLLMPGRGVYAAWVHVPGQGVWPAVVNSGCRPTFAQSGGECRLEAHLIGFNQAIYGSPVEIVFISRLRDERSFADASALAVQIGRDIDQAMQSLRAQGRLGLRRSAPGLESIAPESPGAKHPAT